MNTPCKKCGSLIKTNTGQCRGCANEAARRYREKNKEKIKTSNSEYKNINKEVLREKRFEYYYSNKDFVAQSRRKSKEKQLEKVSRGEADLYRRDPIKEKEYRAKFLLKNKDAFRVENHNRRAKKLGIIGVLSRGIVDKLFKLQKGLCACCDQPLEDVFHIDHIMPLALNGPNTDDNIQLLLPICNIKKSGKHPDIWRKSLKKKT